MNTTQHPRLMRALVTHEIGMNPVMTIEQVPVPIWQPGYSLVRVEAAGVNQLSNTIRIGGFGQTPLPLIQGNDGAGTIVQSDRHAAGARVTVIGGDTYGITENGLFAEYALIPDDLVAVIPDSLVWPEASVFAVNFLTAYGAIHRAGESLEGEVVLVTGATGSVGNALIQITRTLGAEPIGVVSTSPKAEVLRADGIEAIDLSSDDLADRVQQFTRGQGARLAFDPVGGPVFTDLQRSLAREGTLVSIGFTGGNTPSVDLLDLIAGDKRIVGYSVNDEPAEVIRDGLGAITELAEGEHVRPIIDTVLPLDEFEAAYARLTSREAIGSIVLTLRP